MNHWVNVHDHPLPENEVVLCVSQQHWVCIGKSKPGKKNVIITTVDVLVNSIEWWHPIPQIPQKEDDEWLYNSSEWISCEKFPAPQMKDGSVSFILFDEEVGIAEAEYWGCYQSDTWSCKHYFNKPLFWRPFPILPIKVWDVLQW